MGVYAPHFVPLAAQAMVLLNTRHAFVVHGETGKSASTTSAGAIVPRGAGLNGGMDEFSISGPSHFAEVHNGVITLGTITPEDVGLTRASIDTLQGGDACTNARILIAIFSGERSPRRDIVLLNAAAVLVTVDLAPDLPTGVALAAKAIDSGAVTELVSHLSKP
jgi:anthranilate phosphoribosyltransferase